MNMRNLRGWRSRKAKLGYGQRWGAKFFVGCVLRTMNLWPQQGMEARPTDFSGFTGDMKAHEVKDFCASPGEKMRLPDRYQRCWPIKLVKG